MTTGLDGKLLLWDYNDGSLLHTYDLGAAIIKAVPRPSSDGNRLFVIAAVDAVFCLLHALFRVSQEETIDFSRPA